MEILNSSELINLLIVLASAAAVAGFMAGLLGVGGGIIIVPFFVLAFYLPGFYGDLTALILFIIASFTDFLDGMLARMLGEESKLGELLDPIADKIIVATALILLVMDGTIKNYEVVAAIIILTREILISGLREFLAKGKIKLPVSNLAKLKTALQMISIALLLSGDNKD